ncbi:hypothetical protein [Agrococcus jejuensis]|uniref:hypothetical protein n=1 Tax=Agrococcus jejuensis TaxID=399736 RepID=UPI0012F8E79B|nr:hypothetical protein [Agrococcus jejuensis]
MAVVTVLLTLSLASANLENAGQWSRDFLRSPGAAGVAAVIAAAIAFGGISSQVAVSRGQLTHQEETAKANSWWSMFEWAADRALPASRHDQPLPPSVTIATLERLADEATTEIQRTACARVIDSLSESITPAIDLTASDPEGKTGSSVRALASYVATSRDTAASSSIAEGVVYENELAKSLMALAWRDPTFSFEWPGMLYDGREADGVVNVGQRRVVIEIKMVRDANRLRQVSLDVLRRLRARNQTDERYVLVTPIEPALTEAEAAEYSAVAVRWQGPQDASAVKDAIERAARLP